MKLHAVETGRFRLDGGAMFGVVPKPLWSRTNPADESNRILLAMRCLLIEDGNRLILVDNGIGHKYNDKFRSIYAVDHTHSSLDRSLASLGFHRSDITDVILTHFHFDHGGGSTEWDPVRERAVVAFPNAVFWVQRSHVEWALAPNEREKASFLSENIMPVVESGQLMMLDGETELFPDISLKLINGHTEAQQLPLIRYKGHNILYCGDLFPTFAHLPVPYVMGYDIRPLVVIEEKKAILPWLRENHGVLFFEHDPEHECATVALNEKGHWQADQFFRISEL